MKQIADFAPTRDLPLVIVSTTVWNIVLLLASYPAADWIGAVVLGYVAVWLSRFIIVQSVSLILGMLLKYLKRVAGQLNVELPG